MYPRFTMACQFQSISVSRRGIPITSPKNTKLPYPTGLYILTSLYKGFQQPQCLTPITLPTTTLVSLEVQWASPFAQPLSKNLQDDDNGKHAEANGCLNTEAPPCSLSIGPSNLEVGDDEATSGTSKIGPSRNLAAALRVTIQDVGGQADSSEHHSKHIQTPNHF